MIHPRSAPRTTGASGDPAWDLAPVWDGFKSTPLAFRHGPMSQDTDPYRTELIHFARMQANTLPSVPHMHFLHTLEGLAQRAARDSALASTVNGRVSFYNEQYGITYEIDHPNRRIVVTDVSPV